MQDYHVHSNYSFDGEASLGEMCRAARAEGLEGLCFTDHVDFDLFPPVFPAADLSARNREIEGLRESFPELSIRRGVELSLGEAPCIQAAFAHIGDAGLDFIIASLHVVDGVDTYYPEYFQGRSREEAYRLYAERIGEYLPLCKNFSVLGHYDFCTKYAPFEDRAFHLAYAPEAMDRVLRFLAREGKSLEVNTSPWRDCAPWGLDVLRRFRELGGEYVTFGSDAHRPGNVGQRFGEAAALVKAAGIGYYATFDQLKPTMHKIP